MMSIIKDLLNRYFWGIEGHCNWEKLRVVVTVILILVLFNFTFIALEFRMDLQELQKNITDSAWFCLNVFNVSNVRGDPFFINWSLWNESENITALYTNVS